MTVVFLAELHYTSPAGVDVPSLLTSWVSSGPAITVNSIQLQVDTTCPAVTASLQPQSCSVTPSTDVTATAVGASIAIAVVIITVAAVIITVAIVIVIALLVVFRKRLLRHMTWYVCNYQYHLSTLHHYSVYTYIRTHGGTSVACLQL